MYMYKYTCIYIYIYIHEYIYVIQTTPSLSRALRFPHDPARIAWGHPGILGMEHAFATANASYQPRAILRKNITRSYYRMILRNDITELYDGFIVRNYIAELDCRSNIEIYYRTILQNDVPELLRNYTA